MRMKNLIVKSGLIAAFVLLSVHVPAQTPLEKLWETDTVLYTPESVLYDAGAGILYVSNIGDFNKEGTGSISKVGLDGTILHNDWVKGLTATKGLGLYQNMLYAAEPTAIAVIDVDKGAIVKRIEIEGAQMLNDVTVDTMGNVYVSDSRTGKVHKIEQGKVSDYMQDLKAVNGLLSDGEDLYILADGKFLRADRAKNLTVLSEGIEGGADGIAKVDNNEFILTGWEGTVYHVKDGVKTVLSDTREQKINAADLGYNPTEKIIYLPTFFKKTVVAYKLK